MRKHAKHSMHMWIVSWRHKKVSCLQVKSVFFIYLLFFILGTLYVVTSRKSMEKKTWENKNIYRWLLYTKYKAENNNNNFEMENV